MVHKSIEWNTEYSPVKQLVSVDTAKITLQHIFSCNSKLRGAQFALLRGKKKSLVVCPKCRQRKANVAF